MRNAARNAWLDLCSDPNFVFLTGDLGYSALEDLQNKLGKRFINAGVAEQNMVSVAAGLCKTGLIPWVYSIAPFSYARPFEQIRNDVCIHRLPVKIIGNGGGFTYGVMGATHHALEDYGVMSSLQNMRAYIPSFSEDLADLIPFLQHQEYPCYLRLGRAVPIEDYKVPKFQSLRQLCKGENGVVISVGTLAVKLLTQAVKENPEDRPSIWTVGCLPIKHVNLDSLIGDIHQQNKVVVIEDHVKTGGLGEQISCFLLENNISVSLFKSLNVTGYNSGLYGNEDYHLNDNGLTYNHVKEALAL